MKITAAFLTLGSGKNKEGLHLKIKSTESVELRSIYKTIHLSKIMYFEAYKVYYEDNEYTVFALQVGYLAYKKKDFIIKDFIDSCEELELVGDAAELKKLREERSYC